MGWHPDSYQQAAIAHGEGPAIVRAGPGSGKTRVIVERVVLLIDDGAARPEELLVLTFSRKAAADLRQRIADRLRRSHASFPITTFHAFCSALLGAPRLARPAERRRFVDAALAAERNLGLRPTRALAEEALAFCSLCDDYLSVPDHPLARVRENYLALLREADALDYGGLLREAVTQLERNPVDAYRYVLVDEFQDTDVVQERLLELLAPHKNVFVVADEDQSIYGFRGAEIENALGFEGRWGARSYVLPTNYRSAPPVVELATSVIRRNVDTHTQKPLRAADERPAQLRGRRFRHPSEEADWIAREIAALRLEQVPLGEIAVLARSLRELGPRLAYSLRRHGIPFHVPLAPPLHPTVDALLALIELAHAWDDELALRTLASPLFAADPLELRRYRRGNGLRDDFPELFQTLGIVKRQHNAGGAVYALWERIPYFRNLQTRCRALDAPREDVEELAQVTALSDAANEFDGELADFLKAYRSGELAGDDPLPPEALPADAVAVLSVHQAKGLEWEAVFVADLVEGRFPALARSQYALFDRADFARRALDEAARARRALEEERRLFYVALTRARTRLYLTATEEASEEAGRSLSRFYLEAQRFLDEGAARDGFVSQEEALVALRRAGGGPPGWRDLAETANRHAMHPTGGLRISASSLAPYENCPLQFYYGSLLELVRPRGAALVFGGIFHDVLEAFHDPERGEPQTLERLLELGRDLWREGVIKPAPYEAEHKRKLERLLMNYYVSEMPPEGEVLLVERKFAVPLDASTLSGRIDRIDRRPDGPLRLVDYKTSREAMPFADAEQDLQLALYALACAEEVELAALGEIGDLVYVYPAHMADGRVAQRGQTVTPDLVERTRERVRGLVAEIVAERFEYSPQADCMFCDFKRICPRHFGGDAPV